MLEKLSTGKFLLEKYNFYNILCPLNTVARYISGNVSMDGFCFFVFFKQWKKNAWEIGRISSGVLSHRRSNIVNNNILYSSIARREDFESPYHKVIDVWDDESANYHDLIITHYIHVSKHHTVHQKYVQILCTNKIKQATHDGSCL